jgi:hypothetical protein
MPWLCVYDTCSLRASAEAVLFLHLQLLNHVRALKQQHVQLKGGLSSSSAGSVHWLAAQLAQSHPAYAVTIHSPRQSTGQESCFNHLHHECIMINVHDRCSSPSSGSPQMCCTTTAYIVEHLFREQFTIPCASPSYQSLLYNTPEEWVGPASALKQQLQQLVLVVLLLHCRPLLLKVWVGMCSQPHRFASQTGLLEQCRR